MIVYVRISACLLIVYAFARNKSCQNKIRSYHKRCFVLFWTYDWNSREHTCLICLPIHFRCISIFCFVSAKTNLISTSKQVFYSIFIDYLTIDLLKLFINNWHHRAPLTTISKEENWLTLASLRSSIFKHMPPWKLVQFFLKKFDSMYENND